MKTSRVIFLFLSLTFFSHISSADRFLVQEPELEDVNEVSSTTVKRLISSSITKDGDHKVVNTNEDFALKTSVLRIGSSFVVTITKSKNTSTVFSAKMKMKGMDELDVVLDRLARAVIKEDRSQIGAKMGEVTEQETKETSKKKITHNRWSIALGPYAMSNSNSGGTHIHLSIGYSWEMNSNFMLKLSYDSTFPKGGDDSFFGEFSLGGLYALNKNDWSPVVMGTFGYGSAKADGANLLTDTITNFIIGTGVGIQFFRTSTVLFEVMLKYSVLLENNQYGKPSTFGLRLGIYW